MQQLYGSWEAVAFQHHSALAAKLTALFQDIMDYRDKITTTTEDRIDATVAYAKKAMNAKFGSIVQAATGFNCRAIHYSKGPDFGYACLMILGPKDGGVNAAKIIDEYTGTGEGEMWERIRRYYNIEPVTAIDMIKITNSLNKATGKFGTSKLANGRNVGFALYFDPYTAFLMHESVHSSAKAFTADEVAAIVVHEIGHMHTMLEHALDYFMRVTSVTQAAQFFNHNAPLLERLKLLIMTHEKSDPKFAKKLSEIVSHIETRQRSRGSGTALSDIFEWIIYLFVFGGFVTLFLAWINTIFNLITMICERYRMAILRGSTAKTSDLDTSVLNFKLMERMADEFAIRHGLGGALVSSLGKLEYNISGFNVLSRTAPASKDSRAVWNINKFLHCWIEWTIGTPYMELEAHDTQVDRNLQSMRSLLAVFKEKLSPELLNFYVEDYERMVAVHKNRSIVEKFDNLLLILHKIKSYLLVTPAALLLGGRYPDEYARLVDRTRDLIGNKLFYRSAKLQQLANKHKA